MSAIEKLIETYSGLAAAHPYMPTDEIGAARAELAALRAEIERLTREKQDEFDIASGYHKQLQKAKATVEAQATEIERLTSLAVAHGAEGTAFYYKDEWEAQAKQIEQQRAALDEAATSLETIALAGSRDGRAEFLRDLVDVRGYATSRASVARTALSSAPSTVAVVPLEPFGPVYELFKHHAEKKTWHHRDEHYWLSRLVEEVGELSGVINGRHNHPKSLELQEIASICLSWLVREAAAIQAAEKPRATADQRTYEHTKHEEAHP